MQRKVNVVEDLDGNKIVFIHDIVFKGKRSVEWSDVEAYLKRFVGEEHIVEDTGDLVYIGPDLPDEYTHSNYTMLLRGANAKAKANAAQGIPEMLLIANEREFEENRKDKHSKNAKVWMVADEADKDIRDNYKNMRPITEVEDEEYDPYIIKDEKYEMR